MMVGLSELLSAAQALYQQVETVKANRAQLTRLAERIRLLLDNIRGVKQLKAEDTYAVAREGLRALIFEATTLSVECQSADYLTQFCRAGSWQDTLTLLHQRLDDCVSCFDLGLNTQGLIDQAANQAAMCEDVATLRTQVATALADSQHSREQLDAIAKAITVLSTVSTANQQALNTLAQHFESMAKQTPTGAKIIVSGGGRVRKIVNQRNDVEAAVSLPEDAEAHRIREVAQIANDVFGATASQPPERDNLEVVFVGDASAEEIFNQANRLLGRIELTQRTPAYGNNPASLFQRPGGAAEGKPETLHQEIPTP